MNTVLIGRRPQIIHETGRWGEPQPSWSVPVCGFVPGDLWAKIQDFQRSIGPSPVGIDRIQFAREAIKRKIGHNPSKSTVWQFNLQTKIGILGTDQGSEYIRASTCLGERLIVRWTWFDVYVKAPVLRAYARLLTKLRYNPEF